jgi:transposase
VLSDIMGQSGRAIVDALARCTDDAEALASLVKTRVRASLKQIVEALRGRLSTHQRLLLRVHLGQVDAIDNAIAQIDQEVGERLEPFRAAVDRLVTIPGVSDVSASVVVSEIGFDMGRFATSAHLVSWAGLCPKNDESAGKRRSTTLKKGAPWLNTLLVQTAWYATRAKGTYLRALFLRLKSRRGPRKAIMAVAASMLTSVYWMLKRGVDYADLGADHFDRTDRSRLAKKLARKLDELGFDGVRFSS